MKKLLWFLFTCLVYVCLAVGLWLAGGDMHEGSWYMAAALPVFLFSLAFYVLTERMRRSYYASGAFLDTEDLEA